MAIRYETDEPIAVITIDRPGEMFAGLDDYASGSWRGAQ
jgi:hypothetical protein